MRYERVGRALAAGLTRVARTARGERGTTLLEVLVVAGLSLVVLGATLVPLATVPRAERRADAWQEQVARAGAQESRMMHEIRQAYNVLATTPNSIRFLISVAGVQQQLYYECDVAQPGTSYRQCVRVQAAVGASLPALSTGVPIVTNLLNGTPSNPVFAFAPDALNPIYATVHVEFPASGGAYYGPTHDIIINDGAYLRNTAVTT